MKKTRKYISVCLCVVMFASMCLCVGCQKKAETIKKKKDFCAERRRGEIYLQLRNIYENEVLF